MAKNAKMWYKWKSFKSYEINVLQVKKCVKLEGEFSEFFHCNVGLMQGVHFHSLIYIQFI